MKAYCCADFDPDQLALLREHLEVAIGGWGVTSELLSEEELRTAIADVDVLIIGYEVVSARTIEASPRLKLIASTRGGPDANIDIAAATKRGIPVTYTIGREAPPVADFTFGLIISLLRNIYNASVLMQQRVITGTDEPVGPQDPRWGLSASDPWLRFKGHELAHKTLGIVGLGSVGREVARRARGFDMPVLAFDPYVRQDSIGEGIELIDLPELLRRADIVSLHARLTPTSIGMIGPAEFARMKPTAYLVNTARATLVDEAALYRALDEGQIAGAALDVFHREPLSPTSPLLDRPNVLVTPHIAGSSHQAIPRQSESIVESVLTWLRGDRPKLLFNREIEAWVSPTLR